MTILDAQLLRLRQLAMAEGLYDAYDWIQETRLQEIAKEQRSRVERADTLVLVPETT